MPVTKTSSIHRLRHNPCPRPQRSIPITGPCSERRIALARRNLYRTLRRPPPQISERETAIVPKADPGLPAEPGRGKAELFGQECSDPAHTALGGLPAAVGAG